MAPQTRSADNKRDFDLVCYGVTGFTGQLCAQYLNSVDSIRGKWAVAGRNEAKIKSRLQEVGVEGVPVIIADSSDPESLDKMCKRTKVICSLVGPYVRYGEPLVKACVDNGTHYTDLNGEAPWCYNMMKKYGDQAMDNKATLVFSTGYDSVPSELTVFIATQKLKALGKGVTAGSAMGSAIGKGSLSGGTFATLLEFAKAPSKDKKVAANPYCLSPVGRPENKHLPFLFTSTTFKGKRQWGSFWLMGPHNSAIVRRSWGVFESGGPNTKVFAYGPDFKYDEMMAMPNPVVAIFVSLALFVGFGLLTLVPPIRWAAERFGPQPGTGPSKDMQENGWFKQVATVRSTDGTKAVQVTMKGKGDPGYAATSKMIAECALALVHDYERLPPVAQQGGFLTPAAAYGPVLVERLEKTGYFTFTSEVEEAGKDK
ncbi:hypothetical protein OIO90_000812 [Microbotryomycetes sp. JL221]|nr:hypothetical protein OIO90_000812 [Microbotryomycetes sp. JL221]